MRWKKLRMVGNCVEDEADDEGDSRHEADYPHKIVTDRGFGLIPIRVVI